jgi:hypothetical protein
MTITISNYTFEGPYVDTYSLKNQSGVYVILSKDTSGKYDILDVGESAKVKERVESHDRKQCWLRNSNSGGLSYAAYYTTEATQMRIEQTIRNQYNPPCGKE